MLYILGFLYGIESIFVRRYQNVLILLSFWFKSKQKLDSFCITTVIFETISL